MALNWAFTGLHSACRHTALQRCWNFSRAKYARHLSSTPPAGTKDNYIDVSLDETTGIAILRMNRKPVNGLNLELLTSLAISLDKLESDSQCKGLVITSAVPKIFSAGLDITEMYQPERGRLVEFWRALQNFWMKLYVSPLATAAAINGHSPAGGCLIALSCDYRVMSSSNATIGLNETLLGILAPFWFIDSMRNVIGHRESERALQLGTMFTPADALKIGLVDNVVNETETVETARLEMLKWLKVPGYARQLTKEHMRKHTVEKLEARQDQDTENFVNFITKDAIQKGLGRYLESLKRPKN